MKQNPDDVSARSLREEDSVRLIVDEGGTVIGASGLASVRDEIMASEIRPVDGAPIVILGQGDYRREIRGGDI